MARSRSAVGTARCPANRRRLGHRCPHPPARRHVGRRPMVPYGPGQPRRVAERSRDAEIAEHRPVGTGEQHVRRLHIAMEDALAVCVRQTVRHLAHKLNDRRDGQGRSIQSFGVPPATSAMTCRGIPATRRSRRPARRSDASGWRQAEPRDGSAPAASDRQVGERQHLHGDRSAQRRLKPSVHRRHAALAERGVQARTDRASSQPATRSPGRPPCLP